MILKTPRLILRPYKGTDEKELVKKINNINVVKWLEVVPYPYTIKDAKYFLNSTKKKKNNLSFAITLKKELIGGISLRNINNYSGTADTGYWLAQDYWKKGYGSEALKAVLDYAFKKLKLQRVEAIVYTGNPASGKLLQKFGAKLEGTKRKASRCKSTGKVHDELMYGILREEYEE